MAVTKRTRFEVLRRDNHTCRYCGASAPVAKLTVDHVTPVALGGTDRPSNLVAACRDCNYGKSSTTPDAALVEDVKQDALRHAELVRGAYDILVERMGERNDYIYEWIEAWQERLPVPPDWENTIGRWFEMGVPIEIVTDAARIASTRTTVTDSGRFSYMCGVVWKQVQMVDELAETYRYIEGRFMSESDRIDYGADAWSGGWDFGYRRANRDVTQYDPLSWVVDRIQYKEEASWPATTPA